VLGARRGSFSIGCLSWPSSGVIRASLLTRDHVHAPAPRAVKVFYGRSLEITNAARHVGVMEKNRHSHIAYAQDRPGASNVSISSSRGSVNDFRGGQRSSRAPPARCRTVIVPETPFSRACGPAAGRPSPLPPNPPAVPSCAAVIRSPVPAAGAAESVQG